MRNIFLNNKKNTTSHSDSCSSPPSLCLLWFPWEQVVVIASIVTSTGLTLDDYVFPPWSNVVGWGVALSSMLFVPVYAVYKFFSMPGTFREVRRGDGVVSPPHRMMMGTRCTHIILMSYSYMCICIYIIHMYKTNV